jgi:hypothetical protein
MLDAYMESSNKQRSFQELPSISFQSEHGLLEPLLGNKHKIGVPVDTVKYRTP